MTRRRIPYSAEELAWLRENHQMVISDYHRAFVAKFDRHDVQMVHLNALRKRKGWTVNRHAPGRYDGRNVDRRYSPEELSFIEWRQAFTRRELHTAFVAKFGRTDLTVNDIKALCTRKGWTTGRTGCFEKGMTPANKGKTYPEGVGSRHPNARKTQFKKGQKPHTYRGPGHERIDNKDGYVIMTVEETNPWTGASTRPVFKHKWLWEQKNGPVPPKHVLKCLDGNKLNTDPSNWKAIPKSLLPRLAGRHTMAYDDAPAELKPALLAIAELEHKAREAKKSKASR